MNSPTLFRTVPSLTPCGLFFPKIGDSQPPPKTPIWYFGQTSADRGIICMKGLWQSLFHHHYISSPTLFRRVPFPTPTPPFPILEVRNPHPKLQSLLSQERIKLRTSNLDSTFTGSIQTKAHCEFLGKGSVGVSRDCPNLLSTPIISGSGKAMNFKFYAHIHRLDRNKSSLKISGKVVVGVVRDFENFGGIARSSLR